MRNRNKIFSRKTPGNVRKDKLFGKFRGKVSKVRKGPLPEKQVPWDAEGPPFAGTPFIKAVINNLNGRRRETAWATPAVPLAGAAGGEDPKSRFGSFRTPQIGDVVWIEFEQGDERFPVWTGMAWNAYTFPAEFSRAKEYLKKLPKGGQEDETEWYKIGEQKPKDKQAKETHQDNAPYQKHTNVIDSEIAASPDDPGEPLPVVAGEKTPGGYFWLIHEGKKHLRLHTPHRNYLLLNENDDGGKRKDEAVLHGVKRVLLRDQDDDRAWVEVNAKKDEKHTIAHGDRKVWLRDLDRDNKAWVEVDATEKTTTVHGEELVNIGRPGHMTLAVVNGDEIVKGNETIEKSETVKQDLNVLGSSTFVGSANFQSSVNISGSLTAAAKFFREDHPEDDDKEIFYASMEGPEAGTYLRGEAELVDGKAVIKFPDHFGHVTSEENLTAQLTPVGGWSKLYIDNLTTSELIVKTAGGDDAVTFNYFAQGERTEEDFDVVQDKNDEV